MTTGGGIRRKLSNAVVQSKLPFAMKIANVVRSKEDNAEIARLGRIMANCQLLADQRVTDTIAKYPALHEWLNKEKTQLLPGGVLTRNDAVMNYTTLYPSEYLLPYMQTYAITNEAYVASMVFFCQLPRIMASLGYLDHATGEIVKPLDPDTVYALDHLLRNKLADRLCRAVPGRWHHDALARTLKSYL